MKSQSNEDKRVYYVETTDKANEMKSRIIEIVQGIKNKMLSSLLEEEQNVLNSHLEQIVNNLL